MTLLFAVRSAVPESAALAPERVGAEAWCRAAMAKPSSISVW